MYRCQRCEKKFELAYKVSTSFVPKYCSKECRNYRNHAVKRCLFCKVEIKPTYHKSTTQRISERFCTKSCAGKFQKGLAYLSRDQLIISIKNLIKSKGRYVTVKEILKATHVSCRTLNHLNISAIELNKCMGYKKPQSIIEDLVYEWLCKSFPKTLIERQKKFDGLVGLTGHPLRVDFLIGNKVVLELDDPSHWNPTHKFYTEEGAKRDALKDTFFSSKSINLLRIKYTKASDFELVKTQICTFLSDQGYLKE